MAGDKIPLAWSALGLAGVTAFSIPAVVHLVRQVHRRAPKTDGYEDEDGQSSQEALEAFSTKWSKVAILSSSILGGCLSIAIAVLSTLSPEDQGDGLFLENWLVASCWALLAFQAVCIGASRNSVDAYYLGICSTVSCLALACILAFHDHQVAERLWKHDGLMFAARAAEIASVLCLGFASVTLPRRPDVFYEGELVEPLYSTTALSRYTWSWPSSILKLAMKKDLSLSDLPRPNHLVRAKTVAAAWESRDLKHSLWISVTLAHKWSFILQWTLSVVGAVLNFAPQWVVLQILNLLEQRQDNESVGYQGWFWAIWLMVAILAQAWVDTIIFWLSWAELCVPIRAELSSLIFQKSMRRKDVKGGSKKKTGSDFQEGTTTGQLASSSGTEGPQAEESGDDEAEMLKKSKQSTVNLIGVDAKRVAEFANFNWFFPSSAFKLIVSLVFLLDLLGWKALVAGFATMVLVTPVNIYFSKKYSEAQDKLMQVRDEKMGVVSEALQGIRQIKFSALEPQWENKIGLVRERELKCVWDAFVYDVMLLACWATSPVLLAAASLAVYATLHGMLTPSVAFVSLSVFKALELTLSVVPELTTDLLDAWVSVNRIDAYLRGAEIKKITNDSDEISFQNASIAWPSDAESTDEIDESDRFILRDVSLTFPKGELSVISGKTGSGKSLLLAAVLGEVDLLSGSIAKPHVPLLHERHDSKANKDNWIIPGAIAYVAQIPWIENATFKDNILFDLPYDDYRYKKTIEVCALVKDIEMLADGDETEIGANGINLSGGQKWRITLARAIYSRAGILVLDDIFSAVDAHVGRHIFEKCLNGELGVGRTRVLVTHHVALCEPKTKYLVELGDGRVLHAGLLSELEEAGTLERIKSHEQAPEEDVESHDGEDATAVNSEMSEIGTETGHGHGVLVEIPPKAVPQPRKFVEEEKKEEGAIKRRVYSVYLKYSGSWPFWTGAVIIFLLVQALTVSRSWWLRIWTGQYEDETLQPPREVQAYMYQNTLQQLAVNTIVEPMSVDPAHGLNFYLGIYIALSVGFSLLTTLRWYYVFAGSIRASRELFARLNFIVLRAPVRWLDTVPVGRILNRFTADFHSVDTHLAYAVAFAASASLNLLGVVTAGLFVSPVVILLSFILLSICVVFARRYIRAARSVKRMESITKSPVFEQFGSSLTGVLTIRAFNKSQTYVERMYRRLDDWSTATWHLWLFNRWMAWRMSFVGSLFALFVTIFILLSPNMDSALAGFALAFALEFSGHVTWTVRHYANAELEMNAAERIVEYTDLPTENLGGVSPPAAWPTEGRVEVNDLVVSYADDLPPVLKGLNFSIKRNERVGVIGRTGAGKSSLTLALFRFVEARSGSILIDGLDISKIKLHDLRSRLAIIPQDPVLFSGTVRSNLDPFDNHTDAELFDSLMRVHLISEDEASPGTPVSAAQSDSSRKNTNIFSNLSSTISEGGLNLSQGQRQLLCLARAIVSRPKVMVLDEATSAVDMATDALIQRSIREEFGDSTLVVIAHRLSTIADFDRILVLSDGRVAEFGTPRELWEAGEDGEGGIFRAMCEQSGEVELLRRIVHGGAGNAGHEKPA